MIDKKKMIENRITLLEGRKGVDNKNIIAKLKRELRRLKNQ